MPGEVSAVSRRLKEIRRRAGLSIREVAEALGMEHGSSYQHYEDRYRKPLLPLDLPASIRIEFLGVSKTLEAMLAAGELDALFSLYLPESFLRGAPHIVRARPKT